MFLAIKGQTFLIPSGPIYDPDRLHLHVLLTSPFVFQNRPPSVVLACMWSVPDAGVPYDSTCILNKGDHPFINHSTFVDYSLTSIIEVQRIENGFSKKLFKYQPTIDDKVIIRITTGLCLSSGTPHEVKAFYWATSQ
jgi:hypothetical protein